MCHIIQQLQQDVNARTKNYRKERCDAFLPRVRNASETQKPILQPMNNCSDGSEEKAKFAPQKTKPNPAQLGVGIRELKWSLEILDLGRKLKCIVHHDQ